MTTFSVTTLNDSGPGSLRQAILDANALDGADTINFDPSLSGQTITLTSGELRITDDLTIDGDLENNGVPDIIVQRDASADAFRIFDVDDRNIATFITVALDGLTITGGLTVNPENSGGAGIFNLENLTVSNSAISGNTVDGLLSNGGGIFSALGALTVSNSTISGNTVSTDPINAGYGNGGGIFSRSGTLTVSNSTISGNTVSTDPISSDNGNGGGIFINLDRDEAVITNSTISGNSATNSGGGIFIEGFSEGALQVRNSTITENTASANQGSGVASRGNIVTYTTVVSSIIAGNTNSDVDFVDGDFNSFVSVGNNLIGVGNATDAFNRSGDINGELDPGLAPLGDNGGSTQTHALLELSSAIDAGSNPDMLATDQRGQGFVRVVGSQADIGAFEAGTPVVKGQPATIFVDSANTVVGNAFQAGQTYTGDLFSNTDGTANPDDVVLGTDGADNIWSGAEGSDIIDGGAGNDTIGFGDGDACIHAGDDDDFVYAAGNGAGVNEIDLGAGADEFWAPAGNNTITGTENNTIGLGTGDDTVNTGDGVDFVYSVNGGGGVNLLNLGEGANTVYVENGDYTITTGSGADSIGLGVGTDSVKAGDGDNIIYMVDPTGAADGDKDILTGLGDDFVQTGSGDDLIDAGAGLNTLFGGAGGDTFIARSGAFNFLGDFELGADLIDLDNLTFDELSFFQGTGDTAADAFIFVGSEAIGQVANTTVAELDNSANFV